MRKNHGWWLFAAATLLPAAWLFATADEPPGIGWGIAAGVGWLLLAWSARRGNRRGRWFPHRCNHCKGAMRVVAPARLKPPPGTPRPTGDVWHCPRCGKLVR